MRKDGKPQYKVKAERLENAHAIVELLLYKVGECLDLNELKDDLIKQLELLKRVTM